MTKHFTRTTALTCAALAISMVLAAGSANAKDAGTKSVRLAQERLIHLGYYPGTVDGTLGEVTKDALRDFQSHNGLVVTGALTDETYQLLKEQDMGIARGYYYGSQYANGYRNNGYYGNYYAPNGYYNTAYRHGYVTPVASNWNGHWNGVRSDTVPIRYGQLAINDAMRGGVHNYSVTLNGHSVLQANNQPVPLRVSHTYRLNGEDAVIFTAYDGTGSCNYKNYLLTVRADGTYVAPQQVGNCSGEYQARVENGGLVISFAGDRFGDRYAGLDTWRYGNGSLMRI